MESGDYIYYLNGNGDTVPAQVCRVMRVYMWIDDGVEVYKVRKSSCRLQDKSDT